MFLRGSASGVALPTSPRCHQRVYREQDIERDDASDVEALMCPLYYVLDETDVGP